jgi:hypothetical protein
VDAVLFMQTVQQRQMFLLMMLCFGRQVKI